MKSNPVGWFEIYVNDMARAKKFYESVFQFEMTPLPTIPGIEMMSFPMDMNLTGAPGALAKMEGFGGGGGNSVLIYFSTDDCSVEEKRVVSSGGKIQKPKFSIGQWGFISLVLDSEGNMIGLHSKK
jgi:predicted enzyme related to lactoylglutathione lyase